MKTIKTPAQTEAQIITSSNILKRNIDTFYRIVKNTDHETFKKDAVLFRSGLVGVVYASNGAYTIPERYNDLIDAIIDGKHRSDRQAYKNSLVACFFLGKHGTNSKAYLDNAKKGKTHLEALTELEWARIKTVENKRINDAKKERDAKKAQADVVTPTTQADVVTPTTQADVVTPTTQADVVTPTTQADVVTPTTQADVVTPTTQAATAPAVQTVKISPDAGISKDAGIRGEALYKSLFNSESEAVLIYLARKILAELQA